MLIRYFFIVNRQPSIIKIISMIHSFFKLQRAIYFISTAGILLQTACKNDTPKNNIANPFSAVNYETQKLSDADKIQLANASGKTLIPIASDSLAMLIKKPTDKLHVYCFWRLKNEPSVATVRALKKISDKIGNDKLSVTFVTMSSSNVEMADYNLFIREQQITDAALVLENGDVSFFSKKLKKDFVGITNFPVVLLVNTSDNILQIYNKPFDENELTAMIQPFL